MAQDEEDQCGDPSGGDSVSVPGPPVRGLQGAELSGCCAGGALVHGSWSPEDTSYRARPHCYTLPPSRWALLLHSVCQGLTLLLHRRFYAGPGPFPAVLDLWGGGGNLMEYRASLLASHGFAALALDYLTNKVTMTTGKRMKNDYFEVMKIFFILSTLKLERLLCQHHNSG
ncbi:hypothetical protein NL108_014340 [Boleophthalmus pectinirostris]|nr:hypothetical protein NL108_014340 [Boleophthalmus pectinirostris]